jgi:hypothetical protein
MHFERIYGGMPYDCSKVPSVRRGLKIKAPIRLSKGRSSSIKSSRCGIHQTVGRESRPSAINYSYFNRTVGRIKSDNVSPASGPTSYRREYFRGTRTMKSPDKGLRFLMPRLFRLVTGRKNVLSSSSSDIVRDVPALR